ncbi:MAG: histidinol dehydrogenase [Chitinophagaceae bacterium]|nr:histidinol dehydrogenase [Chitinophagaceae bacterium]
MRWKNNLQSCQGNSIAVKSLASSKAIVVDNLEKAIELANEYAAEHLIVVCKNLDVVKAGVRNAGSVFLGPFSPESVGDYASGTNHTLPTNGFCTCL